MPNRRVAVELTLDTARYVAEARAVERTTASVDHEMHDLDRSVDAVDRDMGQLAVTSRVAARGIDDIGDEALGAAAKLEVLGRAVRGVGGGGIFNRGGGAAGTFDFSQTGIELRYALIGGLIEAIAIAAPLIGAMISGAIIGGVGVGGIVGGTAAAAKDERVKTAFKELGTTMAHDIAIDASSFVVPLQDAAAIFSRDWKVISADLTQVFNTLSRGITPLAAGIGGFVHELMPGLEAAAEAAVPILEDLKFLLPELGDAFSDFFEILASDTVDARGGFQDLITVVSQLVRIVGATVGGLSAAWSEFKDQPTWVKVVSLAVPSIGLTAGAVESLRHGIELYNETSDQATEASDSIVRSWLKLPPAAEDTTRSIEDITKALDGLLKAVDKIIPAAFSLEEAQDRAATAAQRLKDQIVAQKEAGEQGAGQLAGNTQAARDNREAVRDLVELYGDLIVKTAEAGGSTDGLKKQLYDQLVQMGLNKTEVQRYVDQLDRIPVTQITSLIVENQQALAAIQETDRELRRLQDRSIALTAYQAYRSGERQHGGPVEPYGTYLVGERGPEVIQMGPTAGWVYPSTQAWAGSVMGSDGASMPEVHVYIGDQELKGMVRVELRDHDRDVRRRVQGRYRRSSIEERI